MHIYLIGQGLARFWRDVTADGDVESNPGPPPVAFPIFCSTYAQNFVQNVDRTVLARHCIDVRHRCLEWPSDWLTTLFGKPLPGSDEDCVALVAAYEVYADATLAWDMSGASWIPKERDEVAHLRERLRVLELRAVPPTMEELAHGPSGELAERFLHLPGLLPWVHRAMTAFLTILRETTPPHSPAQADMWRAFVDGYFHRVTVTTAGGNVNSTNANFHTPGPAKARHAPITAQQVRERGGRLETEVLAQGVVTWAILGDAKYYVSKKGALWDTSLPPPAPCFGCGEHHWFWECRGPPAGGGGGPLF